MEALAAEGGESGVGLTVNINLKSLVGRFNPQMRRAVEGAAGLCNSRTHYDIEIEHFLLKLLELGNNDLTAIIKQFELSTSRVSADLARSLDKLKTGNARTPVFSPSFLSMLTQAWTLGSLNFNAGQIRSGHALLALVSEEELARLVREISLEFAKISAPVLRASFEAIVSSSQESAAAMATGAVAPAVGSGSPGSPAGPTPLLDQYTLNLTENARAGKVDSVLGRDFEIRQVVDILTRRRQNNPILVGEAGVGKTAIVEGFALRVANGDVPPPLRNVQVRTLDLALLQAGAGVKGEFENRLKGLIAEVRTSTTPIILFIDEAHTMIGAGGQAGQNDAANLLKPALARGELRTIAATTWPEYKKYFEKDPALTRRFQVVKVDEPSEEKCLLMMRGIIPALEKHHGVRILDEGLAAAVHLSNRYLPDRFLPDKAVSVLDTACARLSLSQNATPGPIEDLNRTLDDFAVQSRILEREQALGVDHRERLARIAEGRLVAEKKLSALEDSWQAERRLVEDIRSVRGEIEAGGSSAELAPLRDRLEAMAKQLAELQGERPLMRVSVDAEIVGEVISGWTGIPSGKMLRDELQTTLDLETHLEKRVVGQSHAICTIAERVRTSRAGMDDPAKPVGVFLLVGPSGVGKTETALALADLLYGGEDNVITINMSEFQEPHTVSTLKGSPPGYVGYGEGGVLTEAVRRRPHSVVLLDEVEKAHPDVMQLFLGVFDKGRMEDGEGREIDFRNTILILTSNACADKMMRLCADPENLPESAPLVQAIKRDLDAIFRPALLGRLVIVPYYPVSDATLRRIVELKLDRIQTRLKETQRVTLNYDVDLLDAVVANCTEPESGARNIDNILTNSLLPGVAKHLLTRMAEGQPVTDIRVQIAEDGTLSFH